MISNEDETNSSKDEDEDEDVINSGESDEQSNQKNGSEKQVETFYPALRYVGIILIILAVMNFVSLPIAWFSSEIFAIPALLIVGGLSVVIGSILAYIGRGYEEPSLYQIFWMGALSWLVISIGGAFTICLIALATPENAGSLTSSHVFNHFTNALFESISGFTSSGLTLVAGREADLSATLQWWRSISQWVGGLGFISLVLMYIQPTYRSHLAIETELADQEYHKNPAVMARHLWIVYAFLTAASIGVLAVQDLSVWEAINYGLTGISTGGFGITNESMGNFSRLAQWTMIGIVILGAINFAIYDKLYHCDFSVLKADKQLRWFILGLMLFILTLFTANYLAGDTYIAITDLAFHGVSAAASAGFATTSEENWPASVLLILILGMFVGGCKGSTAGGIKIGRLRAFVRLVVHFLKETKRRPDVLFTFKGAKIEAEFTRETYQAIALIFLWIMTGVAGVFALSFSTDATMSDIVFETYSALGCVGLSNGLTSASMPDTGKYVLMVLMWLGRLEIIPIFAFLLAPFYR